MKAPHRVLWQAVSLAGACVAAAAGVVEPLASQAQVKAPPSQDRPVFRDRVVIVPIDVSVLDRQGKPVTDLTQEDFTVFEDKVPQPIKAFAAIALAPEPPPPDQPTMLLRTTTSQERPEAVTPQKGRVFLIVFGWGRIEEPTDVFQATTDFIRRKLLPQDHVGLLAWNRATDLTTNHEEVARIVERYRTANPDIIKDIEHWETWNPSGDLPMSIQERIDAVFTPSDRRRADPGAALHFRSVTAMLFDTEEFKNENRGHDKPPWNDWVTHHGQPDNYLQRYRRDTAGRIAQTPPLYLGEDLPKIYAAIEYLRHIDGEKHLVLCIPSQGRGAGGGLAGPDVDDDARFSSRAGDARIAVDVIHTSGVPAFKGFRERPGFGEGSDLGFNWFMASAETVAEDTGGQFLGNYPAAAAFARIDQATRFAYLLGYTPSNMALDDSVRNVKVRVNRRDVSVYFRHGYHAREEVAPLQLTDTLAAIRKAGARDYDGEIQDLDVSATATAVTGGPAAMRVGVKVDAAQLVLTPAAGGRRTGGLHIAIYCGSPKEQVVGELQLELDLDLSPEEYQRAQSDGLRYSFRVLTTGETKYVKVVVYDFATDRTGSAMVTVR